ncbi:MAG: hypothetical protein AAGA68_17835 [Pseudomonadota bacterium]
MNADVTSPCLVLALALLVSIPGLAAEPMLGAEDADYPSALLEGTSHPAFGKYAHSHLPATAFASKAPISLSWRLAAPPTLGEPVAIHLDFRALTGLSAEVKLIGEEGLEVQSADFAIGHRLAREHWSEQILVTPTLASRRYLNIVVSTVDDWGARRMRGFAVPVVVDPGAVRAKAYARVSTDGHGVVVRSMPAREEVLAAP